MQRIKFGVLKDGSLVGEHSELTILGDKRIPTVLEVRMLTVGEDYPLKIKNYDMVVCRIQQYDVKTKDVIPDGFKTVLNSTYLDEDKGLVEFEINPFVLKENGVFKFSFSTIKIDTDETIIEENSRGFVGFIKTKEQMGVALEEKLEEAVKRLTKETDENTELGQILVKDLETLKAEFKMSGGGSTMSGIAIKKAYEGNMDTNALTDHLLDSLTKLDSLLENSKFNSNTAVLEIEKGIKITGQLITKTTDLDLVATLQNVKTFLFKEMEKVKHLFYEKNRPLVLGTTELKKTEVKSDKLITKTLEVETITGNNLVVNKKHILFKEDFATGFGDLGSVTAGGNLELTVKALNKKISELEAKLGAYVPAVKEATIYSDGNTIDVEGGVAYENVNGDLKNGPMLVVFKLKANKNLPAKGSVITTTVNNKTMTVKLNKSEDLTGLTLETWITNETIVRVTLGTEVKVEFVSDKYTPAPTLEKAVLQTNPTAIKTYIPTTSTDLTTKGYVDKITKGGIVYATEAEGLDETIENKIINPKVLISTITSKISALGNVKEAENSKKLEGKTLAEITADLVTTTALTPLLDAKLAKDGKAVNSEKLEGKTLTEITQETKVELDKKVDKETGKGLSEKDFSADNLKALLELEEHSELLQGLHLFKGDFDDLAAAKAAIPTPSKGFLIKVGTSNPVKVYIYSTKLSKWLYSGDSFTASKTSKTVLEYATETEVMDNTIENKIVNPKQLLFAIQKKQVKAASSSSVDGGSARGTFVSPKTLSIKLAKELNNIKLHFATEVDIKNGTSETKVVNPKLLKIALMSLKASAAPAANSLQLEGFGLAAIKAQIESAAATKLNLKADASYVTQQLRGKVDTTELTKYVKKKTDFSLMADAMPKKVEDNIKAIDVLKGKKIFRGNFKDEATRDIVITNPTNGDYVFVEKPNTTKVDSFIYNGTAWVNAGEHDDSITLNYATAADVTAKTSKKIIDAQLLGTMADEYAKKTDTIDNAAKLEGKSIDDLKTVFEEARTTKGTAYNLDVATPADINNGLANKLIDAKELLEFAEPKFVKKTGFNLDLAQTMDGGQTLVTADLLKEKVTKLVEKDTKAVYIGASANQNAVFGIAIGNGAGQNNSENSIAIGKNAGINASESSIAIGYGSTTEELGDIDIKTVAADISYKEKDRTFRLTNVEVAQKPARIFLNNDELVTEHEIENIKKDITSINKVLGTVSHTTGNVVTITSAGSMPCNGDVGGFIKINTKSYVESPTNPGVDVKDGSPHWITFDLAAQATPVPKNSNWIWTDESKRFWTNSKKTRALSAATLSNWIDTKMDVSVKYVGGEWFVLETKLPPVKHTHARSYLNDGSVEMEKAYVPAKEQDLITKKFMEDHVANSKGMIVFVGSGSLDIKNITTGNNHGMPVNTLPKGVTPKHGDLYHNLSDGSMSEFKLDANQKLTAFTNYEGERTFNCIIPAGVAKGASIIILENIPADTFAYQLEVRDKASGGAIYEFTLPISSGMANVLIPKLVVPHNSKVKELRTAWAGKGKKVQIVALISEKLTKPLDLEITVRSNYSNFHLLESNGTLVAGAYGNESTSLSCKTDYPSHELANMMAQASGNPEKAVPVAHLKPGQSLQNQTIKTEGKKVYKYSGFYHNLHHESIAFFALYHSGSSSTKMMLGDAQTISTCFTMVDDNVTKKFALDSGSAGFYSTADSGHHYKKSPHSVEVAFDLRFPNRVVLHYKVMGQLKDNKSYISEATVIWDTTGKKYPDNGYGLYFSGYDGQQVKWEMMTSL